MTTTNSRSAHRSDAASRGGEIGVEMKSAHDVAHRTAYGRPIRPRSASARFAIRGKTISELVSYGSIAIILIASATKNNTDAIADSEWWSEYTDAPIIAALKSQYPILLLLAASLLLSGALRVAHRMPKIRPCTILLMVLYSYILSRSLIPAPDLAVKYILALGVTAGIALNLGYAWMNESLQESARKIFLALLWASLWVVATNFYNVVTGNGSVPGMQRLIGVAGHPNFTGVQLALGTPFLLFGGQYLRRPFSYVVLACLPISMYMIYLTGSRTALLVLAAAIVVGIAIRFRISFRQVITMILLAMPVLGIAYLLLSSAGYIGVTEDSAFYRGENTRAQTFVYLINAVAEHPFAGLGYFEGLPENSLLRGWAAFGIAIPILMLLILTVTYYQFRTLIRVSKHSSTISALAGSYAGVLVGSLLEGYLVDAFSFSMLIFCILALFSDRAAAIEKADSQVRSGQIATRNRILNHSMVMASWREQ